MTFFPQGIAREHLVPFFDRALVYGECLTAGPGRKERCSLGGVLQSVLLKWVFYVARASERWSQVGFSVSPPPRTPLSESPRVSSYAMFLFFEIITPPGTNPSPPPNFAKQTKGPKPVQSSPVCDYFFSSLGCERSPAENGTLKHILVGVDRRRSKGRLA